jgi:hypothetical protein
LTSAIKTASIFEVKANHLTFSTKKLSVEKLHKIKRRYNVTRSEHGYTPWQIDIIAIYLSPKLKPQKITHYKNIPSS